MNSLDKNIEDFLNLPEVEKDVDFFTDKVLTEYQDLQENVHGILAVFKDYLNEKKVKRQIKTQAEIFFYTILSSSVLLPFYVSRDSNKSGADLFDYSNVEVTPLIDKSGTYICNFLKKPYNNIDYKSVIADLVKLNDLMCSVFKITLKSLVSKFRKHYKNLFYNEDKLQSKLKHILIERCKYTIGVLQNFFAFSSALEILKIS